MNEVREAFPAPAEGLQKGLKERLRSAGSGVLEALSPRRQPEKIRTSTPEDTGKRKKLEVGGGGGEEMGRSGEPGKTEEKEKGKGSRKTRGRKGKGDERGGKKEGGDGGVVGDGNSGIRAVT